MRGVHRMLPSPLLGRFVLALVLLSMGAASIAHGQAIPPAGGGGAGAPGGTTTTGTGGAGGTDGMGGASAGGVIIDANGVLRTVAAQRGQGSLVEQRKAAAQALPGDLRKKSTLRKVALSRLEAEVAKAAAMGRGIPAEMRCLAGLTRIQYVFVYPAAGDSRGEVVVAGPAEGWMTDGAGRVVGIESGAPSVLLEDLATAMRVFPPGQPANRVIGCSIDPKKEGLAALQNLLKKVGSVNPQVDINTLIGDMRQALGMQTVRVDGVSPATHFAQVMVEADYRMKLIGIGLEPAPVKMSTWIELASAGSVAQNALQRWYFVPDERCVRISDDDLGIELVGRGVKLVGADEVVQADGSRKQADRGDRASKLFAQAFTMKYPEIAARNPVYAQLRTLVDLAVTAAYLQEHDAYGKTGWEATTLRDEKAYSIETLPAAREVETAINAVWRGPRLLTPIGGGVTIQPHMALDSPNLLMDEQRAVAAARDVAQKLPADRWWWD